MAMSDGEREIRVRPTPRPFRFGVCASGAGSRAEWAALARRAEDLGYTTFLVGDHFYWGLAPFAALMAAAETTSALRVGGFVFNNDLRHPAVLAKEAATLDLLSAGRLELGLGAGWYGPEYAQAGLPFDSPGVRVERLAEAVHVIKGLFREEPVTFAGRHYAVSALEGVPKPVQRPHPPLLLGGGGRRMLELAGREADIISLIPKLAGARIDLADASLAAMGRRLAWVRRAAGEQFDRLEISTLLFDLLVTDRRQQGAELIAARWSAHRQGVPVTSDHVLDAVSVLVGSVDGIVEQLQRWREVLGISYVVVWPERHLEDFAPVVARLSGR